MSEVTTTDQSEPGPRSKRVPRTIRSILDHVPTPWRVQAWDELCNSEPDDDFLGRFEKWWAAACKCAGTAEWINGLTTEDLQRMSDEKGGAVAYSMEPGAPDEFTGFHGLREHYAAMTPEERTGKEWERSRQATLHQDQMLALRAFLWKLVGELDHEMHRHGLRAWGAIEAERNRETMEKLLGPGDRKPSQA